MDDTLIAMGYPGEDGSRTRANSRRQPPWQSSGAGPTGYGGHDEYAQDDSYAGYDDYGQQAGYDLHAAQDGYGQQDSYGQQDGDGYRGYGSAGYPAQQDGYGWSGGQPVLPGGRDGSGGYPVQGGPEDVPGRYAGNDWYGGPPAAAPGSGFADTGTYNLDERAIDSYGTGPRPPFGQGSGPQGFVHTGQQERYDDYYPGQGSGGYPAVQGYDEHDDYADPYQDRYGGYGPGSAGDGGHRGQPRSAAKRGKRPLLIAALVVLLVAAVGGAAYVFVLKPKPAPGNSAAPTGPLPSPGSSSAANAACVKQLGQYCHIELRTDDPAPLTVNELFPPAFVNQTDHGSFTRVGTKLDTTCSSAVIGQDLVSALQDGKCTQVVRASYVSGDGAIMGTIGVANLSTTNEAHHAGKIVGTNDFIDPLSTKTGPASKLGKGTGIVEAEYKGHYVIMIWAEFTSTNAPANSTQAQHLQQFGADLIAGTANISLSQRMVSGHPATVTAS